MQTYHNDLLVYLGDGNELTFPALGSLLLSKTQGSFSENAEVKLRFARYSNTNYLSQIQYFSNLWDKSEISINRFFIRLSDNILATCQKEKEFSLPHVGAFSIHENILHFNSYFFLEHMILNSSLTFSKNESNTLTSHRELNKSIENKEQKAAKYFVSRPLYFKNVAAVLLLFIGAFFSLFIYNNYFHDYKFPVKFDLKDSGYLETDLNKAPTIKHFPDTSSKRTDREIVDVVKEVNPYNDEESQNKEQDLIDVNKGLNTITENNNVETGEKDFINQTNTSNDNFCLYILGSFSNMENIISLNEKVSSIGSNVVTSYHGNLTRVGVRVLCDDESQIQKLKDISPGLWLLK